LRARIVIVTPTKLSGTEEELLRRYAEERKDHVLPAEGGLLSKLKSAFS
jgi:RNase adaptor protein for sRNA GlmZ degradation